MSLFVAANREAFGVEPICRALQISPATVRSSLSRPPTRRNIDDAMLEGRIQTIFDDNYKVYGRRKIKAALVRELGLVVDKDRVGRLMAELGIRGATRGRKVFTTKADPTAVRAPDLVKRHFEADRPNALWVTDFTYVRTWAHMAYVAFIIDVYARHIVGWSVSTSMKTELVSSALEQALWKRGVLPAGLVAHSDAGSQYTAIRYTERLQEIGARPSIGTVGDSYDNAMAESTIGLYKTELTKPQGPWRNAEQLELATLLYVEWFNRQRIHSEIGNITPIEAEANFYQQQRLLPSLE